MSQPPSLRILQVTPRVAPFVGGVETHVREVAKRLLRWGVETAILSTDPTHRLPATDVLDGVPVRRVRAWPERRDWFFAPALVPEIVRGRWDVVHVQSYHTFVAPLAMAAAAAARIPYVLTFHGGGHSKASRTAIRESQVRALRPLLARARALVAIAEFELDHYGRPLRIPRERFVVIPNGADLVPSSPEAARVDGRLIVSPGRLERYKGHHRVLAAFPHVLAKVPDARLWIAGDGDYESELRALAHRLGVAHRVEISATTTRAEMARRLGAASLAVLLSEFESQPLAALEAASLGIPLVMADNSGMEELAARGLGVSVALDARPEDHAKIMIGQLLNPPSRSSVEVPTWDACAAELLTLYRHVAETRP